MSRSQKWLSSITGAVVLGLGLLWAPGGLFMRTADSEAAIDPAAVRERRQSLHTLAEQWVNQRQLARSDRYVYTIDAAQLAIYAARSGDRSLYRTLRDRLVKRVVVNKPNETFSDYFVAWRYWAGEGEKPLDASGTTEALRLAKALWLGAKQYNRPADRDLAMKILRAYMKHQATFEGIWLIRNYYNLQQQHFATNSYTIDYDPDLVAAAAKATDDKTLARVAEKSATLIERAISPAGLIRQIIQPELVTLMPSRYGIFSPNNIEQVSNSAEVALASHETVPEAGRGLLDFALSREGYLRLLYNASTGEPVTKTGAGAETYAPLVRLAIRHDRRGDMRHLLRKLMMRSTPEKIKKAPPASRAYNLGQTLLTLQRVQRYRDDAASLVTLP